MYAPRSANDRRAVFFVHGSIFNGIQVSGPVMLFT